MARRASHGLWASIAILTATSSAFACVVGTGMSASCAEAAFAACLPGGGSFDGTVTFDCGGAATITVIGTKFISADTTIDGENAITINGGGRVQVFVVNNLGITFTVHNLTIANGRGNVNGGAIFNNGGTVTVSNCLFSGGSGLDGGAIENLGGTLTVTNSTFSANSAASEGGAIFNNGGMVTVSNCIFSSNSAGNRGGAVSTENGGMLTVTNTTFFRNTLTIGGTQGGAILNRDGALTLTNSTFYVNSGALYGGAILNGSGPVSVTNCTFSDNSTGADSLGNGGAGGAIANEGGSFAVTNTTFSGNNSGGIGGMGGAIFDESGTLSVTNSILASSVAGSCSVGHDAVLADGGHNIDDGTTCGFSGAGCATTTGTSFCTTNPHLDPAGLSNNGGPTETIAVEAGSPTINAGDESVCAKPPVNNLDQRGFVRPGAGATNCSIGAYEFNAARCGDVNGDGLVNIGDALIVAQFDVGLRSCGQAPFSHREVCDVNADGGCNIGDALRMAQCDVGLISCTFSCVPSPCP